MRGDVVSESKEMHRKGDYRGTKQVERGEIVLGANFREFSCLQSQAARSERQVDSQLYTTRLTSKNRLR